MDAHAKLHPTDQTLSSYGLGKLDDALGRSRQPAPGDRARTAAAGSPSSPPIAFWAGSATPMPRAGPTRRLPSSRRPPACRCWPAGIRARRRRRRPAACRRASPITPTTRSSASWARAAWVWSIWRRTRSWGGRKCSRSSAATSSSAAACWSVSLSRSAMRPKLHHPNVVTAYAVVRLGESLVLAMEYVDGLDLARLVKARGPLPVAHACNYLHQAALGLQHAHENGMVHRDIKPGNLMLSRQGGRALVKVLDFGLAKVIREGPTDGDAHSRGPDARHARLYRTGANRRCPASRHPRRHLQPGLHALLPVDRPGRRFRGRACMTSCRRITRRTLCR